MKELDAAICTAVVDDKDLVIDAIVFDCFDDGREALREEVFAVPVEDDEGGLQA